MHVDEFPASDLEEGGPSCDEPNLSFSDCEIDEENFEDLEDGINLCSGEDSESGSDSEFSNAAKVRTVRGTHARIAGRAGRRDERAGRGGRERRRGNGPGQDRGRGNIDVKTVVDVALRANKGGDVVFIHIIFPMWNNPSLIPKNGLI